MAVDTFGRRIDYLRISVTDGCNMRCIYCMPNGPIELKDRADILTFLKMGDRAFNPQHGDGGERQPGRRPHARIQP